MRRFGCDEVTADARSSLTRMTDRSKRVRRCDLFDSSVSNRLKMLSRQVPDKYLKPMQNSEVNDQYGAVLFPHEFRGLIDYERGCISDAAAFFVSIYLAIIPASFDFLSQICYHCS